ncbi:TetR/AcrR family transcriptional regulator [Chitinimonas arctica]|uniref:TetR/AcrR family transcriptional regulator n=1 Tax=Chitinimonas arctica TaxID=2594795 RepID=A0A516SE61_9NEIS|nr:TetR/AcrR family transcriptional regulator [Chitinimonas arctica]QDQ26423.1 TetR/AcrR family transcriptional regulator [Chitinimonas arctica]
MKSTKPPSDPAACCAVLDTVARWTRRKDARPGEILDAALDLFVARGFAATKVEDIARAAGVTAGTIYRYFANKEEILKAVIRESFAPALLEGEALLANFEGSAAELLTQVIRTWWQLNGATRLSGIPKLMIAESNNFPELARFHREEVIARGEALIGRALQYGIDRGEFRPQPVELAVKVVTAPVVMAMVWKHTDVCGNDGIDLDRYLDIVIETLIHGLGVRPGTNS